LPGWGGRTYAGKLLPFHDANSSREKKKLERTRKDAPDAYLYLR